MVWYGVVCCAVVWYGMVWCGVVWCGVVWCGALCRGVVWCAVICCAILEGVLQLDTSHFTLSMLPSSVLMLMNDT